MTSDQEYAERAFEKYWTANHPVPIIEDGEFKKARAKHDFVEGYLRCLDDLGKMRRNMK